MFSFNLFVCLEQRPPVTILIYISFFCPKTPITFTRLKLQVTLCTMATLRRDTLEPGSAREAIAMLCRVRMAGWLPSSFKLKCLPHFSRHHLEVLDRHTEFSGPWQLLHPLPDSGQLQLSLNFSIAARWAKAKNQPNLGEI